MAWALRLVSIVSAAIASLFVARDALNFGIIETLITVILIVLLVIAAAIPDLLRRGREAARPKQTVSPAAWPPSGRRDTEHRDE